MGLTKDELSGKIMTEFATLRPKAYIDLAENIDENKKEKEQKNCAMKWKLKFEDCKHCLEATQLEN